MDFNGLCQPDICLNIYVIAGINKNCLQLNCISHFFKSKINVKVVKLSDKLISGGQIHCWRCDSSRWMHDEGPGDQSQGGGMMESWMCRCWEMERWMWGNGVMQRAWGLDRGQKARVSLKAWSPSGTCGGCVWEDAGVQNTRAWSQVAVNKSALAAPA